MTKDTRLIPTARGVGFLGVGKYKTREDGKKTKEYLVWYSMLTRCYSKTYHGREAYKDCYVCDEWLNFQNFADWFHKNYKEGLVLDKDKKIKGNKVYSPETCVFITSKENITLANTQQREYKLISPEGIVTTFYSIKDFCEQNNLDRGAISRLTRGKIKSSKGWKPYDTTNS